MCLLITVCMKFISFISSGRTSCICAAKTKFVVTDCKFSLKLNLQLSHLWLWGQSSTSCTSWTQPGICGRERNHCNNSLLRTSPCLTFLFCVPSRCSNCIFLFSSSRSTDGNVVYSEAVYLRINMQHRFDYLSSWEDPTVPLLWFSQDTFEIFQSKCLEKIWKK